MKLNKTIILFTIFLCSFLGYVPVAKSEPVSFGAIYSVLVKFPVAVADRSDSYKNNQLETIAKSIEIATQQAKWPEDQRVDLASYLLTIGYWESRYRINLHEGAVKAHSYGLWQVTPGSYGIRRLDLIGLTEKETTRSANAAALHLSNSWQCGSKPEDHFTAYYGGTKCGSDWKTLKQRVNTFYWVKQALMKLGKQ